MEGTSSVEVKKKKKMVAWYVCGGILVLCIVAFFVYQKGVEILLRRQMENLWANNFSMESISFDPWTSTVELKKMVWKNPHQYSKGKKAITVDEVSANLNAWALFRHVIHFEEVKVRNVALNFEFRKDPTRLTDLLSMIHDGPGINVWDAIVPEKEEEEEEDAEQNVKEKAESASAKASGVWYYRIDHLEITGTRVSLLRLQKLDLLIKGAVATITAKVVPEQWASKLGGIVGKMLENHISKSVTERLQKGWTLPDYKIDNLGQNDRSTLGQISQEVAKRHLNETKQFFQKKKDEYIAKLKGWIGPKVEKLIQKWEKLTGKKKQKKDTANVEKELETMEHVE